MGLQCALIEYKGKFTVCGTGKLNRKVGLQCVGRAN